MALVSAKGGCNAAPEQASRVAHDFGRERVPPPPGPLGQPQKHKTVAWGREAREPVKANSNRPVSEAWSPKVGIEPTAYALPRMSGRSRLDSYSNLSDFRGMGRFHPLGRTPKNAESL